MSVLIIVLKLLGSAAIGYAGYYLLMATGWPPPLDTLVTERQFSGYVLMLLGALCALATVVPDRHPRRRPSRSAA